MTYDTLDACTTKSFWVVTIVDRAQSQLTMGKKLKKPKKVHREGVPILDVARNVGSFSGAPDPAEGQSVKVQGVQGGSETPSGGLPAERRRQGTREHHGGDEEGHKEQDPGAAGGDDRWVHDRGTPEGREQGSWQKEAQLIKGGDRRRVHRSSKSKMFKGSLSNDANCRDQLWDTETPSTTRPDPTNGTGEQDVYGAKTMGQSMHVTEIPGFRTSKSRPSHQSNKYLKTGPKTRHPTGLAAGATRPVWLRGLERYFRRGPGGALPDRNRAWIARERDRNVRRKLAEGGPNGQDTQKTKKRKPGQAPAGPASAGPAGRTRARTGAGSEWECHVEIEWLRHWSPLRAVFPGASCGFPLATSWRSRRSNARFLEVYSVSPPPLEFKMFWAQNRALAEAWRTCVLLTTVFIDWIGPWRSRAQKSALL